METARAFNPFLVAKSNKLKKLIEEVQQQIEGYEAYYPIRQRARRAALPNYRSNFSHMCTHEFIKLSNAMPKKFA